MENYISKAIVIIVPNISPETKEAIRQFLKHIFLGPPTNEIELCFFLAIYTLMTIYVITNIIKAIIWFVKEIIKLFKKRNDKNGTL